MKCARCDKDAGRTNQGKPRVFCKDCFLEGTRPIQYSAKKPKVKQRYCMICGRPGSIYDGICYRCSSMS